MSKEKNWKGTTPAAKSDTLNKPGTSLLTVNGKYVGWAHTIVAMSAFLGALIIGCALHYKKIVQNEHFGYPDEWFPSVSAAIGDRYPERSVFQVFIAITSGPRFALVILWFLLTVAHRPRLSMMIFISGLMRTLTCGGWTYVTSTDDHDWHDIFMISYMVLTIPWTVGCTLCTRDANARKWRKIAATCFFGSIPPLIYFFIQHKVHHIAGAYTTYAFLEWALVIFDVLFDAVTILDFSALELKIVDAKGVTSVSEPKKVLATAGFNFFRFSIDVANATIFWSVLTALPLLIWYFPLWFMGISGYEALLVSICAPFILYISPLRKLFNLVPQLPLLLGVTGIAAWWIPGPIPRLEAVGFGAGFCCIALANTFANSASRPLLGTYKGSAFTLGLIITSLLKFAHWTNNPIWPIMHEANGGWNTAGVIVGVAAALLVSKPQKNSAQVPVHPSETSVGAAFGVGGLIFALHSLLSDTSTIILWVWDGYPVKGPVPVPYGAVTILAMCLGVWLGTKKLANGWAPFLASCAGTVLLYSFHGWVGYAGGLTLTVYLCAVAPSFLENLGRYNSGTWGLAMLVTTLLYLAHVWIVAYAFVPGGPALRERTDYVLIAQQLSIGLGVLAQSKISGNKNNVKSHAATDASLLKKIRAHVMLAIIFIATATVAVGYKRFDQPAPAPYHPEEKLMTAGIWTVHFGLDNDMWASEVRMRNVIEELEVDVIGFLESDTQRVIMGNRDLGQRIAEELGYYYDFGPGPNKHTWGCCLLSKFPIVESTHHLLPSPVGELAPAIHATLDVYGELVDVVVFHSGQEEDIEDRRLQSLGVSEIMKSAPEGRPLILLSYLVTKPLQDNYLTYVDASGMTDIDPSDWDRWCEYILYKNIKRTGYARISRGTITDTEIQLGKFVVDDKTPSTNNRIQDENQVPAGRRFPDLFRGQGVRGHRFHVLDEPETGSGSPRYFE